MDRLSAEDICTIIKTCGESGVTELTLVDFHISFRAKEETIPVPYTFTAPNQDATSDNFINDESFAKAEEQKIRETQLSNMMIEDPAQYEKMLAGGDLIEELNGVTE